MSKEWRIECVSIVPGFGKFSKYNLLAFERSVVSSALHIPIRQNQEHFPYQVSPGLRLQRTCKLVLIRMNKVGTSAIFGYNDRLVVAVRE
jgi:hypothetical protein